jgi:hypothetical protein
MFSGVKAGRAEGEVEMGNIWINVAAGSVLVVGTIVVHAIGLHSLSRLLKAAVKRFEPYRHPVGTIAAMTGTVLALFALHAVEIWVWAFAFLAVGALPNLHDAVFFSTLSFSTLGAEEISVVPTWSIFGSIEGVNGFLLIGWSTSYLIPAWIRYGPFHDNRDF